MQLVNRADHVFVLRLGLYIATHLSPTHSTRRLMSQ